MAFTFIASATGTSDASGTSLACSSSLNIAAGDLLVALVRWESATTTPSIAGATNTLTMVNTFSFATAVGWGVMGYKIAASADGAETFTFSVAAARTWRRVIILQFRPDSGDTVTLDASNAFASGNSATIASGNISTTGTDEVVVGGTDTWVTFTASNVFINGSAATGSVFSLPHCGMWYAKLTATFTNGNASLTSSVSQYWGADIIAFKSVAGGGGGVTYPQLERGIRGLERGVYSGGL